NIVCNRHVSVAQGPSLLGNVGRRCMEYDELPSIICGSQYPFSSLCELRFDCGIAYASSPQSDAEISGTNVKTVEIGRANDVFYIFQAGTSLDHAQNQCITIHFLQRPLQRWGSPCGPPRSAAQRWKFRSTYNGLGISRSVDQGHDHTRGSSV